MAEVMKSLGIVELLRDYPYLLPDVVDRRNDVRARTIMAAGVVGVAAALTGHNRIAKCCGLYAGAAAAVATVEEFTSRRLHPEALELNTTKSIVSDYIVFLV